MLHNLRTKKLPQYEERISAVVTLLTPVSGSDKSGRMVNTCEFQPFDIAGSLFNFKSSDFSIVNLEQIGALSKLKTTYMSNMHDMNIADKFDNYSIPVQNVPNAQTQQNVSNAKTNAKTQAQV